MNTLQKMIFLAVLLAGVEARAQHKLLVCLNNCGTADSGPGALPNFWLAPSVGFDVFTRHGGGGSTPYQVGVIPGVGYGVKYKPSGWTLTSNLCALDLFLQGSLANDVPGHDGPAHFNIDLLPVFTLMDWVSVGVGVRFQVSLDTAVPSDKVVLFSFGVRKSTASP